METCIPCETLFNKAKRRINQARRQTWGELNPVTGKPITGTTYNRKKSQAWKRKLPPAGL